MKENKKMRVLQLFFRQNFNLNELMQQSDFFPNFNYYFNNCKYLAAEKILNSHEKKNNIKSSNKDPKKIPTELGMGQICHFSFQSNK